MVLLTHRKRYHLVTPSSSMFFFQRTLQQIKHKGWGSNHQPSYHWKKRLTIHRRHIVPIMRQQNTLSTQAFLNVLIANQKSVNHRPLALRATNTIHYNMNMSHWSTTNRFPNNLWLVVRVFDVHVQPWSLPLSWAERNQVLVIKCPFLAPWFQAGGHSLDSAAVYTPFVHQ